jgi:hypothetical protein
MLEQYSEARENSSKAVDQHVNEYNFLPSPSCNKIYDHLAKEISFLK